MNFLILWILTILSSYGVILYTSLSLIKNIYDNGYKFITTNLKEYGDKNQDLPINKIFKLSMIIPFYNLFTSFKTMFNYSQYPNRILLELKTLGIIEEMTEFEKQEYEKNPSLKTGLISQSRLEKAMKFTIKEELGESVAYVEVNDDEELDIIYSTGPISRLSKEEQKAKIVKFSKEMTKELVDSFIQRLDTFEKDIIEDKQTDMISNDEAENNLETIKKRKENLIKLKQELQELIDSEENKEIIEEPKTKSMK